MLTYTLHIVLFSFNFWLAHELDILCVMRVWMRTLPVWSGKDIKNFNFKPASEAERCAFVHVIRTRSLKEEKMSFLLSIMASIIRSIHCKWHRWRVELRVQHVNGVVRGNFIWFYDPHPTLSMLTNTRYPTTGSKWPFTPQRQDSLSFVSHCTQTHRVGLDLIND